MYKKAVLFDLDGTLVPMDNDEFTNAYVKALSESASKWGYDPAEIIRALWKGTGAMITNDGSRTNILAFWDTFKQFITGKSADQINDDTALFDSFYASDFHKTKSCARPNPLAPAAVAAASSQESIVILATNPIFPGVGIESRLGWIGMSREDFDYVTTYENSCFCKPNPKYYLEIMEKAGLEPCDCIMIGNDLDEDILPCLSLGMDAILITDFLINKQDKPLENIRTCTFKELPSMLEAMQTGHSF